MCFCLCVFVCFVFLSVCLFVCFCCCFLLLFFGGGGLYLGSDCFRSWSLHTFYFYFIKVGREGVLVTRVCLNDA